MSIKNKVALFYEYALDKHEPQERYIVRDVVGDYLLVSMLDDLLRDDCVSYLIPMKRAFNDHWLFFDDAHVAHSYAKSQLQKRDSS